MSTGNPSHFVAGREPYRGKWCIHDEVMSRAAADEYACQLVESGWRDVIVSDLVLLRQDFLSLASALQPNRKHYPGAIRGNGRLTTAQVPR